MLELDLTAPFPFGLNRRNWPAYAFGLVCLLDIMLLVDHPVSAFVSRQSPGTLDFFNKVTRWGESDWILIPSGVLLLLSGLLTRVLPERRLKLAMIENNAMLATIFVGVGLPGLVADLLKHLVGRSRPVMYDTAGILGFHPLFNDFGFQGWPSGHTTTAFALAMVIGFLSPRWFWLGLLYALAITTSRLVLGAHYPTDVLSGAVMGTLGAYAVRNAFARRGWGFVQRADGHVVRRPMVAALRLARRFQPRPAR